MFIDELSYYNEENASQDPDWAALAFYKFGSVKVGEGWSKKENSASPLERYSSLVELNSDIYDEAKAKSVEFWKQKVGKVVNFTRSEAFSYYHWRTKMFQRILSDACFENGEIVPEPHGFPDLLEDMSLQPINFVTIIGCDPLTSWPLNLGEFLKKIKTIAPLGLWQEPFDVKYRFMFYSAQFIKKHANDQHLTSQAFQALFSVAFLSGSFSRVAYAVKELQGYVQGRDIGEEFITALEQTCSPYLQFCNDLVNKEPDFHMASINSYIGKFSVAHHGTFSKNQTPWNTSVTTDSEFLYLYIGTQNGGMYKIGTGECGTTSGKVYLYSPHEKVEDANWVHCRGKLYLRGGSKELGVISIVCPKTFKQEGLLQLYCPDIFGNATQQILNKNFPILSDSEFLYVVGMRIIPSPVQPEPKPEEEEGKEEKKKKGKKGTGELKLCETLLYKFDLGQIESSNSKQIAEEPDELTKEIFDSFSQYFTIAECQRALNIHKNDIEAAVAWLVEYGDNERGKKIVMATQQTTLCQAEVVQENVGKTMKLEVTVKSTSLLSPDLVSKGIWAMERSHIMFSILTPNGNQGLTRIFSTNPADEKELPVDAFLIPYTTYQNRPLEPPEPPKAPLRGTHITNKLCEKSFVYESTGCYDFNLKRFYSSVFNWQFGLYFNVFCDQAAYAEVMEPLSNFTVLPFNRTQEFIQNVLQTLVSCEMHHYKLPSKWSKLSTVYKNLITHYNQLAKVCGVEENATKYSKEAEKLQKKYEKAVKIIFSAIAHKLRLKPVSERPRKAKKNEKKKSANTLSSDLFFVQDPKKMKAEKMVQAKDRPNIMLEDIKEAVYCPEGTQHSLKVIFIMLKQSRQLLPECTTFVYALQLLCFAIMRADHFIERTQLIVDLREFLWEFLSAPNMSVTQESEVVLYEHCQKLAWKTIIAGWHVWCKETEDQAQWLKLMMQRSSLYNTPHELTLARKNSFLQTIRAPPPPKYIGFNSIFSSEIDPLMAWHIMFTSNSRSVHNSLSYHNYYLYNVKILVDQQTEQASNLKDAKAVCFEMSNDGTKYPKVHHENLLITDIRGFEDNLPPERKQKLLEISSETWDLLTEVLTNTLDEPTASINDAAFEIFVHLYKQSYSFVSVLDKDIKSELVNSMRTRLCKVILALYERFYELTNDGSKITSLLVKWLGNFKKLIVLVGHLFIDDTCDQELTNLILEILDKTRKLFQTDGKNALENLFFSFFEGGDIANERIFETSHPYQRGRQQINETITFPGAIAISIEFDPRCQSDNHYDSLIIGSENSQGNLSNYNGEILAPTFKFSGKVNLNYPVMLQGNSIHIEFNASGQPREEIISNRWGFRLKIRPVYGEPYVLLNDQSQVSYLGKMNLRFGGEKSLLQWVSAINILLYSVAITINNTTKQRCEHDDDYLKWNILRAGLNGIDYDSLFTIKNGQMYQVPSAEAKPEPLKTITEIRDSLGASHREALDAIWSGTSPMSAVLAMVRAKTPMEATVDNLKKRATFIPELQQYWDRIEQTSLYTMLLHTKEIDAVLQHLSGTAEAESYKLGSPEEQIQNKLAMCGKHINEIFMWMSARVQSEREKLNNMMDLLDFKTKRLEAKKAAQDAEEVKEESKIAKMRARPSSSNRRGKRNVKRFFHDNKPKPKKVVEKPEVNLDEKDKTEASEIFGERLKGAPDLLKAQCKVFNIAYDNHNPNKSLNEMFDIAWKNENRDMPSPYQLVGDHILIRMLILLKFEANFDVTHEEEEEEENIELPSLKRAMTSYKTENQLRVEELRKWVESYRKWKQWQAPNSADDMTSYNAPPLKAISTFVTQEALPIELENKVRDQVTLAAQRAIGYQHLSRLIETLKGTPFVRMALSLINGDSCLDGIECCGSVLTRKIDDHSSKVLNQLIDIFDQCTDVYKTISGYKQRSPPKKQSKHSRKEMLPSHYIYTELFQSEHLKQMTFLIRDCLNILGNPSSRDFIFEKCLEMPKIQSFIKNIINMILLTSKSQSKMAIHLVYSCRLMLFVLIEQTDKRSSISFKKKESITETLVEEILSCLEVEVHGGPLDENIIKLENLLCMVEGVFMGCQSSDQITRLSNVLLKILTECQSPIIVSMAARQAKKVWTQLFPEKLSSDAVKDILTQLGKYASKVDTEVAEEETNDTQYSVILHTTNPDEDVSFMVNVIFEWENRYPSGAGEETKTDSPQRSAQRLDVSSPSSMQWAMIENQMFEDLLGEHPLYAEGLPPELLGRGRDLPGYYQYLVASESRGSRGSRGRRSLRRFTGKRSAPSKKLPSGSCSALNKLEKQWEELSKVFEEVKEDDTPEEKERKQNEAAFNRRMRAHFRTAQTLASTLLSKGVSQVLDPMPLAKAKELLQLIHETQNNLKVETSTKLPLLPKNPHLKLQSEEKPATEENRTQQAVAVSLCENLLWQRLDYIMECGAGMANYKNSDKLSAEITGSFCKSLMQKIVHPGAAYSLCMNHLINLFRSLLDSDAWLKEIRQNVKEIMSNILDDKLHLQDLETQVYALGGLLLINGGPSDYIRSGSIVIGERNNQPDFAYVLQGGTQCCLKNVMVLFPEDSDFTVHQLSLDTVELLRTQNAIEELDISPQDLARAITKFYRSTEKTKINKDLYMRQLLQLTSEINWSDFFGVQDVRDMITVLVDISQNCPSDKSSEYWKQEALISWERLVDRSSPNYMQFFMPIMKNESEMKLDFLEMSPEAEDGLTGYTLPKSCYLTTFPKEDTVQTGNTSMKMLKYWEKYIIPRIQDFVRSSFKAYEMEYFFESLKQPLRIGDQQKAAEVAYVLCDQRLPSGVVLPDINHDWSAITIDEVQINARAIAKLSMKNMQNFDILTIKRLQDQGVTEIGVVIRAIDVRASLVLVEYTDVNRLEVCMFWSPVSNLLFPYKSIDTVPSSLAREDLQSKYTENGKLLTSIYARETLLQFMSQPDLKPLLTMLKLTDIVNWSVWHALSDDPVEGALRDRIEYIPLKNTQSNIPVQQRVHEVAPEKRQARLQSLETQLCDLSKDEKIVEELVLWTTEQWQCLSNHISIGQKSLDIMELTAGILGHSNLSDIGANDRHCFPLHLPEYPEQNCGLILSFKKDSFLCQNSSLKFYADASGTQLIHEINGGKNGLSGIAPLVLKQGKVWCCYTAFVDNSLPPGLQVSFGPSIVKCRVFAVPSSWTTAIWLTDVLGNAITSEKSAFTHKIINAITEFLTYSRSPSPIRQIVFKILTRLIRRLRYINRSTTAIDHFDKIGIKLDWFMCLLEEIKMWKDEEYSSALYSSYLQDASELAATCLLPWDFEQQMDTVECPGVPEWLSCLIKTMQFLNYFRNEGNLSPELVAEVASINTHNQWKYLYTITGIPSKFEDDNIRERIEKICDNDQIKIVNTHSDIQIYPGETENEPKSAVILLDGFSLDFYKLGDEDEEEKVEEVQEEVKVEAEMWSCSACTLENPISASICEVCETPRAMGGMAEIEAEETAHVDLNEMQNRLVSKESGELNNFTQHLKQMFSADLPPKVIVQPTEQVDSIDVHVTNESNIVKKFLRDRIVNSENATHEKLHDTLQHVVLPLCTSGPLEAKSLDELLGKIKKLAEEDSVVLWKELENLGIDFWIQDTMQESDKLLTIGQLESIMVMVEGGMCADTRAVLYIPTSFIRYPSECKLIHDQLSSINYYKDFGFKTQNVDLKSEQLSNIRNNWALLKVFNKYVSECAAFFNLKTDKFHLPSDSISLSISCMITRSRGLITLPIKTELQQRVFDKTAVTRDNPPKLVLERLKVKDNAKKQNHVFNKAFDQLKDKNSALFRVQKPTGANPFIAFEVELKGELVVGEAGPYRQFFADVSSELQQSNLDLLCPSPNALGKEPIDKYVISPTKSTATDLQKYEFLGLLMGCCARTGARLTLDLPSFIWKPMTGESLTFEDLESIDNACTEMLKLVSTISPEAFTELNECFCATLSDQKLVDLIPNGRFTPVAYESKGEFVDLLLNCRFNESAKQVDAMRKGLSKIVPASLLNLVTWQQLEQLVCGKSDVDLEMLQRHTRYSGGLTESNPLITMFWEVLKEFSPQDLREFIKFCWGQERLPSNDEDFERTSTRLMIKPAVNASHDERSLPKADTCFFNLELPPYSNKSIMSDKILYAIYTDNTSINADNPLAEQQDQGLVRASHYTDEEGEFDDYE